MIFAAENSNKFQTSKLFWKEKSVEDMISLMPMAQVTLVLAIITPNAKLMLGEVRFFSFFSFFLFYFFKLIFNNKFGHSD
jgi:hypothetical protein